MRLRNRWQVIMGVVALAGLLTGVFALAGPAQAQAEGDAENGATLYAQNCVVCHGEQGEGRAGATLSEVYGGIDPDTFLEETISGGIEGTFMPAWSEDEGGPLTDSQIADIVVYIESWGTTVEPPLPLPPRPEQNIPPVPEVDGDPNEGFSIYQRDCAVCHGEDGSGRAGATLTTAFDSIEPGAFAVTTISRGVEGALMPPFGQAYGGPLSEDEINDVAAYVISIQEDAAPRPAETVGSGSALPLVLVFVISLVVVLALGVAVNRRESATSGEADH